MHIWLQLKPVILQINLLYIYTLAGRGHAATSELLWLSSSKSAIAAGMVLARTSRHRGLGAGWAVSPPPAARPWATDGAAKAAAEKGEPTSSEI